VSLGRFASADTIVPGAGNPQSWDRYSYTLNNPVKYTDPSGHRACDGENCDGSQNPVAEYAAETGTVKKINASDTLDYNAWDWVPIVSNIRGIVRGNQTANWAANRQGFWEEQKAYQTWLNNCYGVCHGASPVPGSPLGGPMPDTPLVDIYSEGMGETAENVVDLGLIIANGSVIRTLPEPKLNTPKVGIRIAPFGNAGNGPLVSQLPHFHFRVGPSLGESYPGFGWRWHHPWEDFSRIWKIFTTVLKK